MLQRNARPGPNGRQLDRARIELRERSDGAERKESDVADEEVRDSLVRLFEGGNEINARRAADQIDAHRQCVLVLLRKLIGLDERLARMETLVHELHQLAKNTTPTKDWYSVHEVGEVLGRAEFTVREWCRLGRVNAAKRDCGRGNSQEWIVSHEELIRIQNEGLLPE